MNNVLVSVLLASAAAVSTQVLAQAPVPPPATPPPAASTPPPPAFAASNLTANGVRSMAATCASCHGTNGNSAGGAIPGRLAGINKEYFAAQMKAFKEGKREATIMHQLAKGYTDAEIAAIGDYFAAQKM